MILLFISLTFVLLPPVFGQTCSDAGIGECLGGVFCPDGFECLNGALCCDTTKVVKTCGDSGVGDCIGDICPADATCINTGSTKFCCSNSMIGMTTVAPATTRAPTTPPRPTTPPLGCRDNISSNCPSITSLCANSAYYNLMVTQCPATCKLCGFPTRPDVLPTTTVSSSLCRDNVTVKCSTLTSLCSQAAYTNLMTLQCPVTCNRCAFVTTTIPPVGNCLDRINPNTGSSDCPNIASYCNNNLYYQVMTEQCPRTCNRCSVTSSTCQDAVNPRTGTSNCAAMASYCSDSVYYDVMTVQCPLTCRRCPTSTAVSSNCVDLINPNTGRSDCPLMTSYCSNPIYTTLMTQQCPRTCNRCSSG